jgi:hypothetical protein
MNPKRPRTVRKEAKRLMVQRLRDGGVYGGKPREYAVMREINVGGQPVVVQATFYHISKFHLEEAKQPTRYNVR